MSDVEIQKVPSNEDRTLPIFAEFDELMDRIRQRAYGLFRNRGSHAGRDLDDWLAAEREICWPAAELEEDDDEFELKVALAGFEPGDIAVTASPHELIIKAVHKSEQKGEEKEKVRWSEFRDNSVYRRVELPVAIDVDKVEAKYKHGMLSVDAPKARQKKTVAKKIDVSTAA